MFAEGFEEVAPNVYKNDLAIIVTAGYAGTYSQRTEPVFDPFPHEWQADVTGPIPWAAGVDPNDRFDCRVDLVTYGPGPNLEVSGEKRVGSMCQAWGKIMEMDDYPEIMQPYFEAAYDIQVPNREISLKEYIDLSMQPGLDSGPMTEYVSASSAFHTKSLASNAPPPARPCEGDSGGGLYLRGTNFLTGIFTSGSAQNVCGDEFFQQVIFFRGARLTDYSSFIKSMREATRAR